MKSIKIAQVATLSPLKFGDKTRYFTEKTLQQIAKTAKNRPVKVGFRGPAIGKILKAWIDDNSVFVEFEAEDFYMSYLVPGLCVSSSNNNYFKTVRCMDFALTNKPNDETLKTISELNSIGE